MERQLMRILVVDDEQEIRESLREIFSEDGYDVVTADNEKDALTKMMQEVDLAIVDIKLGTDDGIEVLRKMKAERPGLPVVMITGFGSIALAKEAFKSGAHDFLEKPLRLLQVRTCVRNALEGVNLKKQLRKKECGGNDSPVIASPVMRHIYGQASRLAFVKEPVVIMGPTGAGKDLLARHLHFEGNRSQGPFIVTNAASLPVNLAEDELFGHEKGAFTGADRRREGCFELANGGTLFLDEIGDMDLQVQAKLLRVLESGVFSRLGNTATLQVDVRLICATHKNLEELVEKGKFRQDLWYRISAFILRIPGLDQRKEDIVPVAEVFLKNICRDLAIDKKFTPEALEYLAQLDYPGNVRELKHLIARLAVYTDTPNINIENIKAQKESAVTTPSVQMGNKKVVGTQLIDFREARLEFEKEYLKNALEMCAGNITLTARTIGMAQSNLSRKLKELGINVGGSV